MIMTKHVSAKMKATTLFGALLLIGAGCTSEPAVTPDVTVNVNTGTGINTSMDTDTGANMNTNTDTGAAAGGETAAMMALESFAATLSEQSDSGQTGTVEITE